VFEDEFYAHFSAFLKKINESPRVIVEGLKRIFDPSDQFSVSKLTLQRNFLPNVSYFHHFLSLGSQFEASVHNLLSQDTEIPNFRSYGPLEVFRTQHVPFPSLLVTWSTILTLCPKSTAPRYLNTEFQVICTIRSHPYPMCPISIPSGHLVHNSIIY
jgi:hypothetical protein